MASSTDFLVNHAYKNVWCSPGQDRQHIVAPTRMTPSWGAIGSVRIGMRNYELPSVGEWYHLFMIGDLPPMLVGMNSIDETWVSVRGHCISTSLLVDLYLHTGVHLPTTRAYFLYTKTGALVIAFKKTDKIANLGRVQPFIRWRSNAWFDRHDSQIPKNSGIEIEGIEYGAQNQFLLFQAKFRDARDNKPGYTMAFVNGQRVRDFNVATSQPGDFLEYVRDASVKDVLTIRKDDLLSFDSTLDGKGKFLIPRPGLGDVIDFRDDVDIYLLNYYLPQQFRGRFYHQNQPDSLRMVTHRDYSIVSGYLRALVDNSPDWRWGDDLRVEVIVRHGGWIRELVNEHHRIKELFKLPEDLRLAAMVGEDALVPEWRAAELEASEYPAIMRATYESVTQDQVEEAYGYNAISRLIGDTPVKRMLGQKWFKVPFSTSQRATAFEYNEAGRLIGWYTHDTSPEYPVRNDDTLYVEIYPGHGGVGHYTEYDRQQTTLLPGVDYRFYICDKWNGEPRNNWRDVTGQMDKYQIVNGEIRWSLDQTRFLTAVRSGLDFLCYNVDLNYRDDLMTVTVRSEDIVTGNVSQSGTMDIPPGELDVFMNGNLLVEDIDYYVEWPQIAIVNKNYMVSGTVQRVVLRGRGFCKDDMTRWRAKDWGFVAYDRLSHNARFHVRDDKVCRISINGQLYTREEVNFSEDGTVLNEIPNGAPYQIVHPIIPRMGVYQTDTYELRQRSLDVDGRIEDYLTQKLPEPQQPLPSPMPKWYRVFSPFAAKLIYDMLNGLLPMDEFKGEYSDQFLRERLRGYDWILKYDPVLRGVDEEYVIIHPHPETAPIQLSVYQYRLLDRANRTFFSNKLEINRHAVIIEEGYEHDQIDHPHPHRNWEEVGA